MSLVVIIHNSLHLWIVNDQVPTFFCYFSLNIIFHSEKWRVMWLKCFVNDISGWLPLLPVSVITFKVMTKGVFSAVLTTVTACLLSHNRTWPLVTKKSIMVHFKTNHTSTCIRDSIYWVKLIILSLQDWKWVFRLGSPECPSLLIRESFLNVFFKRQICPGLYISLHIYSLTADTRWTTALSFKHALVDMNVLVFIEHQCHINVCDVNANH